MDSSLCVRRMKFQIMSFANVVLTEQRQVLQNALVRTRGLLPYPIEYLMATINEDTIYI